MDDLSKSVIPVIESVYETFTSSEKIIADYFFKNSAIRVIENLFISIKLMLRKILKSSKNNAECIIRL